MEENPLLDFDDEEEAAQLAAFKQRQQVDEVDLSIFAAEMEASVEESRHYFYEVEELDATPAHQEEDLYGRGINRLEAEDEAFEGKAEGDPYGGLIAQLEAETHQAPTFEVGEEAEELSEDYTGGVWAPHPLTLSEEPWEEAEDGDELEQEAEPAAKPQGLEKPLNLPQETQAPQEAAKLPLSLRKRMNPKKATAADEGEPKVANPLAAKAKGALADFKEQVKGLRADDAPPRGPKRTASGERAAPGKDLALPAGGGAAPVEPAAASGSNKLLSLLLAPWRWWLGRVGKLLGLLGRIPLLGKLFKLLGSGKPLKAVAVLLPLILVALVVHKSLQVPPVSSPAYAKSLPDEGGFTVSRVAYDPARGVVTAQIANTGLVIVNTTPSFTVTGVQQGRMPKPWHERKTLITCTGKPLQLQIDQTTTLTVACKPLKGKAFAVETKTEES